MTQNFASVLAAMEAVFAAVPYGIEHTRRVLENAELILAGESLDPQVAESVRLAAVLHDIGALEAQRKHGSMAGPFQEQEGPPLARQILLQAGYPAGQVERVCYIVGHHHTPALIDGLDFQILYEADLLDSLQFGDPTPEAAARALAEAFQTSTGRSLAANRLVVGGQA